MSNTDLKNTVEWNDINWRKVQKVVFKLQKRIYKAYVDGDIKKGRRLQKTLIKSYSNQLLSVRKVTQDNQGKKTAGVDRVKSLNPQQRLKLAQNLKLENKAKPIRRVWIPKPGKDEKRPLGIPVMRDRAAQALAKSALEPEWEAKFEPNSYGFRPGRGAHDAIEAIFNQIRYKPKFILDADITKCFDRINHQKLLNKLNTFPSMRRQVRAWLKADICDFKNHETTSNQQGTPQGGVISPLLSNIALHGMEKHINEFALTWKGSKIDNVKSISLIRFADDFVIIHENLEVIKQCQAIITEWLIEYDLEIHPNKTRIVNTLKEYNGNKPGLNFLGFNIRQYSVGKNQSGKDTKGNKLGFKTLIKPSNESIKNHYKDIAEVIKTHNSAPQTALITKLKPIIRGWSNYFKTTCSKKIYSKLDHLIFQRLLRWGVRRHPNKNKTWIVNKYWKTIGGDNWVFGEKEGTTLIKHSATAIKRHVKVKGEASPYNGDTLYWAKRKGSHPELKSSVARLLIQQNGKCNWCKLTFQEEDIIEIDHIKPKALGGNIKDNLQLLHHHCHDVKTKYDLANIMKAKSEKGVLKKSQKGEKPYDGKLSRTVLKTSRTGDSLA
ncbi:putative reverse transcriptase [Chondrocystis sp. NIES-4102]|nr:putative reverse transcriptase [Chondrocystis sp. NIES-4102]